MKKLLYLFSASLLLFTSCSNNDSNSPEKTAILPKTIKITYPLYPSIGSYTVKFVYNGNKIVSKREEGYTTDHFYENYRTDYTYDGNVIVKYIKYYILNGEDIKRDEMNYTYANNKLVMATYLYGFSTQYPAGQYKVKSVYTYNSDGTVKEDLYNIDITTGVETETNMAFVITLANGNVVKLVSNYGYKFEYVYDFKNSPFKNILGFNLLIDFGLGYTILGGNLNSVNNVTKTTDFSNDSTPYVSNTDYVYNADGYPTKASLDYLNSTNVKCITEYTY